MDVSSRSTLSPLVSGQTLRCHDKTSKQEQSNKQSQQESCLYFHICIFWYFPKFLFKPFDFIHLSIKLEKWKDMYPSEKAIFLFVRSLSEKHVITSSLDAGGMWGLSEVRFNLIWSSYSIAIIIWYVICFRAEGPSGASGTHNHTFLIGLQSLRTFKSVVPSRMS